MKIPLYNLFLCLKLRSRLLSQNFFLIKNHAVRTKKKKKILKEELK